MIPEMRARLCIAITHQKLVVIGRWFRFTEVKMNVSKGGVKACA